MVTWSSRVNSLFGNINVGQLTKIACNNPLPEISTLHRDLKILYVRGNIFFRKAIQPSTETVNNEAAH